MIHELIGDKDVNKYQLQMLIYAHQLDQTNEMHPSEVEKKIWLRDDVMPTSIRIVICDISRETHFMVSNTQ